MKNRILIVCVIIVGVVGVISSQKTKQEEQSQNTTAVTEEIKAAEVMEVKENLTPHRNYPKSLASYDDFKMLVEEVEAYRAERMISLDTFLKMSQEENVVILDSRSRFRYDRKHLKGAIHLNFSDFTQDSLWKLLPPMVDQTTTTTTYDIPTFPSKNDLAELTPPPVQDIKILIYCNNNFDGDQVDFMSKEFIPASRIADSQMVPNRRSIMLALNIPTYINLYGYGYRNIYELDELVNVNDLRIEFEGTEVGK